MCRYKGFSEEVDSRVVLACRNSRREVRGLWSSCRSTEEILKLFGLAGAMRSADNPAAKRRH